MRELNTYELGKISGGIVYRYIIIGGVIAFLIGVFDGFTRPLKCNS